MLEDGWGEEVRREWEGGGHKDDVEVEPDDPFCGRVGDKGAFDGRDFLPDWVDVGGDGEVVEVVVDEGVACEDEVSLM